LKVCLARDETYAAAYVMRSRIYCDLRRYEKAQHECDMALKYNPRSAFAYFQRGRALEKMFELEKAQKEYKRAVELLNEEIKHDPRKVQAYQLRSDAFGEMHNTHRHEADRRMADKLRFGAEP
jgi:tetratricopeptide (TPR) repeat protein